jgi:hypothetical protein
VSFTYFFYFFWSNFFQFFNGYEINIKFRGFSWPSCIRCRQICFGLLQFFGNDLKLIVPKIAQKRKNVFYEHVLDFNFANISESVLICSCNQCILVRIYTNTVYWIRYVLQITMTTKWSNNLCWTGDTDHLLVLGHWSACLRNRKTTTRFYFIFHFLFLFAWFSQKYVHTIAA